MKRLIAALVLTAAPSGAVVAQQHEATAVAAPVLSSLDDAVNAVAYFQREVDAHIASNELDKLHGFAFAAADAAARSKGFAASLSEDKKKELDERVGKIHAIARQIDKYGDAKKPVEAKQYSAKLKDESDALQKLTAITARADWKPKTLSEPGPTARHDAATSATSPSRKGGEHHQ
jgi:hypothetical protein